MEVVKAKGFFSRFLLKEKRPFISKQDLNIKAIKKFGMFGVAAAILVLLFLPNTKPEKSFHEGGGSGGPGGGPDSASGTTSQTGQMGAGESGAQMQPPHSGSGSLDYLYAKPSGGAQAAGPNRNAAMVLPRQGADAKTQLPPGTRIAVRLTDKVIVAGQPLPVIGVVSNDLVYEDDVSIPEGSKLYGEVSFNETSGRASVSWKSIEFPDRRLRTISAIGQGLDGQVGVNGYVHSEALKNTIGETISRFIGAYAQGSMQQGVLGAAPGGADNGLKSAVAETAKDRADAWAEDLKKEKKWIELDPGQESYAILDQSFPFRDPGATYGR